MHRSRLCALLIDCKVDDIDAAARFWSAALGRDIDRDHPGTRGNYVMLETPGDEPIVQLQRVEHDSRVHLDIETDDIPAEVARLEGLGAAVVDKLERWVVMQAPSGQRFCVVRVQRPGFPKDANTWDQMAPKLLSGGNPQIAKAYGDAPVQAYIVAMPEWKSDVGRQLDALITRTLPDVRKAVKYNSPLYGAAGREDWFLSFHCFDKYVKVAFFHGAALDPVPPGTSKQKLVRYLDIHASDAIDEAQFVEWILQASQLPGERL